MTYKQTSAIMGLSDWQSGSAHQQLTPECFDGVGVIEAWVCMPDCPRQGTLPIKVLPGFFFGSPVCEGALWKDTERVKVGNGSEVALSALHLLRIMRVANP